MILNRTASALRTAFFLRLVFCSAALTVASCGETPAPVSPEPAAGTPLRWEACRDDFDCTTVAVPVDHGAPAARTIPIALLRAPARQTHGKRIGSLLINPGGPGAPMVERLAQTYLTLSLAFPELADRFDVIAFDWRGVGESAPVNCVGASFFEQLRSVDLSLQGAGSGPQVAALSSTLVNGCKASADQELLTHMDTDHAARDLEVIRRALGEERLNFLGFSSGTLLGARYATLFPEHVGAFVLDSAVAPTGSLKEQLGAKAQAYSEQLDRFFTTCAADPGCKLGGGSDASEVAARFDALLAVAGTAGIPAGERTLGITDFHLATSEGLRSAKWLEFASDLAKAEAGDGRPLLGKVDPLLGRRPDGSYDPLLVGQLAVGCLDYPLAPEDTLESFQSLIAAAPPRSAAAFLPYPLCVGWPWSAARPEPFVAATSAPPVLVIATRNDPLTPYASGAALVAALGNGSHLLTYEGDGHIAAFHSACVREQLTRFLLSPSPPSTAICPPG